jgi:hypothetical protein
MAMASGLYIVNIRDAHITTPVVTNYTLATNKVLLVTDTYTPAFDTHNDYADITNELATANGYTQNSKQVGGTPTWAWVDTTRTIRYSWSAPVVWTSSTLTARGMVVTSAVTTGLLICAVTFTSDYVSTNGDFSITAHATDGIFYLDLY